MKLPPPWIEYPDLPRSRRAPERAERWFALWLRYLHKLSRGELRQYQLDNPAPPDWEWMYQHAVQFKARTEWLRGPDGQAFFERAASVESLIEKMREATTLK